MRQCKPSTDNLDYMGECALSLHRFWLVETPGNSPWWIMWDTHTHTLTLSQYFHKVTHTFIHTYMCTQRHTYTHINTYICSLSHKHSHTHIHAHTETHTHTNTHAHTLSLGLTIFFLNSPKSNQLHFQIKYFKPDLYKNCSERKCTKHMRGTLSVHMSDFASFAPIHSG